MSGDKTNMNVAAKKNERNIMRSCGVHDKTSTKVIHSILCNRGCLIRTIFNIKLFRDINEVFWRKYVEYVQLKKKNLFGMRLGMVFN